MATCRSFSADRLCHIRRLRKARRLFSQAPLFAFQLMCEQYDSYTYEQFLEDLRRRNNKVKRRIKCTLVRFGRYQAMQQLLSRYEQTKDQRLALQAITLRRMMTRPYRVLACGKNFKMEYTLSALIPMDKIVQLVNDLKVCQTEQQATELVERCRERYRIA